MGTLHDAELLQAAVVLLDGPGEARVQPALKLTSRECESRVSGRVGTAHLTPMNADVK